MVVAFRQDGSVAAHMLALLRRTGSFFPPYLHSHALIYGQGEYDDEEGQKNIFPLILKAITKKLRRQLCLFIEFINITPKMFGYKAFRENDYFPVNWQEVHNSLHSKAPTERLSKRQIKRIEKAQRMGVSSHKLETKDEIDEWYDLLHRFYRTKFRKFLPSKSHFTELFSSENAALFSTTYRNKVIGVCACVYSEGNAYLWYLASRRKRYPKQHPNFMTIWYAIQYAYEHNYAHIYFMDAGLPFSRNPYRDFILSFGGKPVSHYRWFRLSLPWINRFLKHFFLN